MTERRPTPAGGSDPVTAVELRVAALADEQDDRSVGVAIAIALGAITTVLVGLAFPWQQVVNETIVTARPGYGASPATAVCAVVSLVALATAWVKREWYVVSWIGAGFAAAATLIGFAGLDGVDLAGDADIVAGPGPWLAMIGGTVAAACAATGAFTARRSATQWSSRPEAGSVDRYAITRLRRAVEAQPSDDGPAPPADA